MSAKKNVEIIRMYNGTPRQITDEIVIESILNIYVNREFYSSLLCTPSEKAELAVGFLFAEEILSSMEVLESITELSDNIICAMLKHNLKPVIQGHRVLTSGCAKGSVDLRSLEENVIKPVHSSCKYSAASILQMMKEFNHQSELFKQTGGVHSCAICSAEGVILFSEDVGRHNALDKVIGKSLLRGIDLGDKLLMTTGRVSSDIALKAARAGIPIIVSHSAPTDMALDIAIKSNITMIGFARGSKMNIYCSGERIYS